MTSRSCRWLSRLDDSWIAKSSVIMPQCEQDIFNMFVSSARRRSRKKQIPSGDSSKTFYAIDRIMHYRQTFLSTDRLAQCHNASCSSNTIDKQKTHEGRKNQRSRRTLQRSQTLRPPLITASGALNPKLIQDLEIAAETWFWWIGSQIGSNRNSAAALQLRKK